MSSCPSCASVVPSDLGESSCPNCGAALSPSTPPAEVEEEVPEGLSVRRAHAGVMATGYGDAQRQEESLTLCWRWDPHPAFRLLFGVLTTSMLAYVIYLTVTNEDSGWVTKVFGVLLYGGMAGVFAYSSITLAFNSTCVEVAGGELTVWSGPVRPEVQRYPMEEIEAICAQEKDLGRGGVQHEIWVCVNGEQTELAAHLRKRQLAEYVTRTLRAQLEQYREKTRADAEASERAAS